MLFQSVDGTYQTARFHNPGFLKIEAVGFSEMLVLNYENTTIHGILITETVCSSETLLTIYQTVGSHNLNAQKHWLLDCVYRPVF
jgi:hypothetical protein